MTGYLAPSMLVVALFLSTGHAIADEFSQVSGQTIENSDIASSPSCSRNGTCPQEPAQPREPTAETVSVLPTYLDRVYAYADRRPTDPGALSRLDADLIANTAADRPGEILNQAPGVNIQMNSGQEHLIAIRSPVLTGGAGQGSFLILENGVPTRSAAFGNVNSLIEPHHELAESIEIIRGPGSARYGSNAVHGLVNVILPGTGPGGSVRAGYGSLGRWRLDASLPAGSAARVNLSLADETGWRDNSGGEQQKISGTAAGEVGSWRVLGWFSGSNLNQETAGFVQGRRAYKNRELSRRNANPEAFRDAWSARAAIRFERPIRGGMLMITPSARSQAMIFSQHFLPYGGVEKNAHTGVGLAARYEIEPAGRFQWSIGADVDVATGYLKEIQPLPNPNRAFPQGIHYDYSVQTDAYALWAQLDMALRPDLKLLAGLRAETHAYDYDTRAPVGINGRFNVVADRTDDFAFLTPKLGFVWQIGEGSLYANYARGARAPQASDLYRLQNRQRAGEVDVETLDSVEIGFRGARPGGRVSYDLAAYAMEKRNFFFRDSDGLNVPDGETRHIGAEGAVRVEIADGLVLAGNLAWSDQIYTFNRRVVAAQERIVSGNRIDTAPEWLADLRLDWSPVRDLRLGLSADHVGDYFLDPANTVTYPGHTVLTARGAWTFANGTEISVIVRNLTDERYADRADVAFGSERYFPGEPLNLTVGLRRTF